MSERKQNSAKALPKFTELNDLCSERNGGKVLFATDDWFAVAENLIKAEEPEWHEGEFTDCGKWMDGWETRRKRTPGHDWCIIKLGVPGMLRGVGLDTAYFTGNFAPRISIQAAHLTHTDEAMIPPRESRLGSAATTDAISQISKLESEHWTEIVPITELKGGYQDTRHNYQPVSSSESWTHVRLNMFPDGGIARLRLYGQAKPDWDRVNKNKLIDLVSLRNGGVCVGYSDAHYGHPRNVIGPGRGVNMADGWETARRLDRPAILEADDDGILQVPGNEWATFKLGHLGCISLVEVDTLHFKGNYPDSIRIEGTTDQTLSPNTKWKIMLPSQKLSAHKIHSYSENHLANSGPFIHVRVTIAPDGGISRLRLYGHCV